MWKKTLLALLVSSSAFATESVMNSDLSKTANTVEAQLQTNPIAEQSNLTKQRSNFLALEFVLQQAVRNNQFSPAVAEIANQLNQTLTNYPLKQDTDRLLLEAKLNANQATDQEIAIFNEKYPNLAKRNAQKPFQQLFQQQKYAELVEYAKQVAPTSFENQCLLFGAQYQLLAEQLELNPETEQANGNASTPPEMAVLLEQFTQFWLLTESQMEKLGGAKALQSYWASNNRLPNECLNLEAYWRDQGFKTPELIKEKAVSLFKLNSRKGLEGLAEDTNDSALTNWLTSVNKLLAQPAYLATFVQEQTPDQWNKELVAKSFAGYLKTLPEDMESPSFAIYQEWLDKWKLSSFFSVLSSSISSAEEKEWKTSFISRFFDNQDPSFQLWRDDQLKHLKADNLTERRLRMAIWQKTDLKEWLELLSNEGKDKLEWQYWAAKVETNPEKRTELFTKLSQERGFYPMLAAKALNQSYQLKQLNVNPLTEQQQAQYQTALARIAELRELKRFGSAKSAWIELLKDLSFEDKLAFSHYAKQQNWYDLAVEGSIQAKAWDHIDLRLPNAYSDWFDINLVGKAISKSFAMAIARQESAWNFEAKSHANAIGLMQMLPTTASQTAKNSQLPYSGERDLVDPFRNIMLGTAHLEELNQKYPNNRILMASAYNAGASRVERWLKRADGRLEMDEFIASIPFLETRGYVQNVLAYDYYYQVLYGKGEAKLFNQEELRTY
ncbi:lytic murein transglycosylase [Pasteurellaceae bacterium LFhippo2]|nr:lytic murein transglycosylase [Pasteurellaceae bacterium LFhippo2]